MLWYCYTSFVPWLHWVSTCRPRTKACQSYAVSCGIFILHGRKWLFPTLLYFPCLLRESLIHLPIDSFIIVPGPRSFRNSQFFGKVGPLFWISLTWMEIFWLRFLSLNILDICSQHFVSRNTRYLWMTSIKKNIFSTFLSEKCSTLWCPYLRTQTCGVYDPSPIFCLPADFMFEV